MESMTRMPWLVKYETTAEVMPRGTPLTSPASLVSLSSRSGLTKLRTTRLTDGWPSPRSMSQWLLVSKLVMSRTVAQVQASLPQCQAP